MSASGALSAGTTSYSSTIAAASTAEAVTLPDRYGYVTVTNESSTAGQLLYARTDGQAATVAGQNCYVIMPGQTLLLANAEPNWFQSSKVIAKGSNQFGGGNTADSASSPGEVTPMESLAGQAANPGTNVSLISTTAGLGYSVAAAG